MFSPESDFFHTIQKHIISFLQMENLKSVIFLEMFRELTWNLGSP